MMSMFLALNYLCAATSKNKNLVSGQGYYQRVLGRVYVRLNREAAKASRKRRTEYVGHLQVRNDYLERENQMLKAQLEYLYSLNIQLPSQDQSPTPLLLSP